MPVFSNLSDLLSPFFFSDLASLLTTCDLRSYWAVPLFSDQFSQTSPVRSQTLPVFSNLLIFLIVIHLPRICQYSQTFSDLLCSFSFQTLPVTSLLQPCLLCGERGVWYQLHEHPGDILVGRNHHDNRRLRWHVSGDDRGKGLYGRDTDTIRFWSIVKRFSMHIRDVLSMLMRDIDIAILSVHPCVTLR